MPKNKTTYSKYDVFKLLKQVDDENKKKEKKIKEFTKRIEIQYKEKNDLESHCK